MKISVTVDDELYTKAREFAEPDFVNPTDIIRDALQTYIRVKATHRLAEVGGNVPSMSDIPRRREEYPKK